MREGKSLRRRGVAIAALTIALCVGVPELAAPAGAAVPRPATRTELAARATTRPALTARPATARPSQTQPGSRIARARARRRAARAAKQRKRRNAIRKRRNARKKKRTKRQRAAAKRRNARKGKRTANRRKRNAVAAKKANGKKSMGMIDWAEVLFFVLLPFLAVAAFLSFTDYQRRPRAPSRQKRKRSLVITPVSRKF